MKTNQFTNRLSFNMRGNSDAGFAPRIFNPSLVYRPALLDAFRATDGRIKNIIVPLDGSAFAEHAIPIALGIAEQSGATLHLVNVFIPADVLDPFDAVHLDDHAFTPAFFIIVSSVSAAAAANAGSLMCRSSSINSTP